MFRASCIYLIFYSLRSHGGHGETTFVIIYSAAEIIKQSELALFSSRKPENTKHNHVIFFVISLFRIFVIERLSKNNFGVWKARGPHPWPLSRKRERGVILG